jgi:guanylate kinase
LELNFASKFDVVIVNDDIQQTVPKVKAIIDQFLIQKE